MKRRSFLKCVLAALPVGAGAVLAGAKAGSEEKKQVSQRPKERINPEWETAEYEETIIPAEMRYRGEFVWMNITPTRYRFDKKTKAFVVVPRTL